MPSLQALNATYRHAILGIAAALAAQGVVLAVLLPIVGFGLMYFFTHSPWKGH